MNLNIHPALAFVLGATLFGFLNIAVAWTAPTQSPPDGNVSAPINVGVIDQIKSAGLGVNSLAVYGNAILNGTSRYLNFGTTAGSSGYGIRDNAGVIEFKNSGGAWESFDIAIQNYFANGGSVQQIKFTDGTVQTTASSGGSGGSTLPLYGGIHTSTQCASVAGNLRSINSTDSLCEVSGSACPAGWTSYLNWGSTSVKTCSSGYNGGCGGSAYCTTGSHAFSNTARETCGYVTGVTNSDRCTGVQYGQCTASVISVGCY